MTRGYGERTLAAAKWSVSGDVAEQAIRLVFSIPLARLLAPRDFGLIAMLMAVRSLTNPLTGLGLGEALVQRPELTEAHRSSAFWALAASGCVLTAAMVLAAPGLAAFYDAPELARLAVVGSAIFIFDALGSVPRALVARRLDFRVVARIQCGVAVVAGTSAVVLAWRGFGPMSLVADLVVTSALENALLLRASRWRPRLEVRSAALRDVARFSAYSLAARVAVLAAGPIDHLIIGKALGSATLGLYVRAYNMMRVPLLNVSRSIVRAMFPSLALIQDDPARVRALYVRTAALVALVTFPMCLGFFATAEPLMLGLFGAQWRDAIPVLRFLSLAGLVQSITALPTIVYLSQGRPELQLRITLLERLVTIPAILIGLRWGLVGTAVAYLLATVVNALPTLHWAGRLIGLSLRTMLTALSPVLLAGIAMAATVLGIDAWARSLDVRLLLALEVAAGVLAYWSALRLLRVRAYVDAIGLLRRPALMADGA